MRPTKRRIQVHSTLPHIHVLAPRLLIIPSILHHWGEISVE
jgi:hypothetical protein